MTVLNYPGQVKLTTGVTLAVRLLPLGIRTPQVFTVTAATAVGTAFNVVLSAAAVTGATSLAVVALTAAVPANAILTLGGQTVATTAAAAQNDTTLAVAPINFDLANGSVLNYNPGAFTVGSTMLPTAVLPTVVDVGTRLDFGGGKVVTVTGRSPAGSRQLRVTPIPVLIVNSDTATTRALFPIVGLTSSPIPSPNVVTRDTTNFLSGIRQENVIAAIGATINANFNIVSGDLGGEEMLKIVRDKTLYNREVFFEVRCPDGERHEGAAMVMTAPEQGEVQNIRSIQATLNVQGDSYVYTPSSFIFY